MLKYGVCVCVYDCLFWKVPDDVMRQSKDLKQYRINHSGLINLNMKSQTLPFLATRLEEKSSVITGN